MKSGSSGASRPPDEPAAAAAYISALTADLAALARRHEFEALAYILDMARLEAEGTVQRMAADA